jgi:Uma2 family endonuclease
MPAVAKILSTSELGSLEPIDVSTIVTEDDTPLDNFASEKQQRLLTEPLYSAWSGPPDEHGEPRRFVAAANVGLFAHPKEPPIVPDVFLSLDVTFAEDLWKKEHRTYFFWEMGKPPEVVIEVVSNREGDELAGKVRRYASMGITHYVVWDPNGIYGKPRFRAFELRGNRYVAMEHSFFSSVGLGLVPWAGTYEGVRGTWLRWARLDGSLVPTGAERAEAAQARAERLAAKLRALGIDPNEG